MPIYKYNCRECGEHQSRLVKIHERDGPLSCRECGQAALDREVAKETPNHNYLRAANPDRFAATKDRLLAEEVMYDLPEDAREEHLKHIEKLKQAESESATITDQEDTHASNNGMDITK